MNFVIAGIDIGGTNTDFGLVADGKVIWQERLPTKRYPDVRVLINTIYQIIQVQLDRQNVALLGVGIGAPNANFHTGCMESPPNLPWKGCIDLKTMVEERFGVSAVVNNDANASALGELKYGAGKHMRDFIVITLGTGIGAGIIVNGQLLIGHDGMAGEVGHTLAVPEGRLCNCGRKGCFERYASATGLKETISELLARPGTTSSLEHIDPANLTSKQVFEAAQEGDAIALKAFDYTARIIGRKMAEIAAYFSPEAIFFLGGLANAGDLLLKPAKAYLEEHVLYLYKDKIPLLISALPDNKASILGAAAAVEANMAPA